MNKLFTIGVFLIAVAGGVLFIPLLKGQPKLNEIITANFTDKATFSKIVGNQTTTDADENIDIFNTPTKESTEKKESIEVATTIVEVAPIKEEMKEEKIQPRVLAKALNSISAGKVTAKDTGEEIKKVQHLDSELLEDSEKALVGELLKYKKQVRKLSATVELSAKREGDLARDLAQLRKQVKKQTGEKVLTKAEPIRDVASVREVAQVRNDLDKISMQNVTLESYLKESRSELATSKEELKLAKEQIAGLKSQKSSEKETLSTQHLAKVRSLEAKLEKAIETVGECSFKLTDVQRSAGGKDKLKKELVTTQHELLLREAELQNITSVKGKKVLKPAPSVDTNTIAKNVEQALNKALKKKSDVPTVKVSVAKANLRSGPGLEHSAVMQLSRGATLVVEATEGDWLRVISPKGGRAFIKADVVGQKTTGDLLTEVAKSRAIGLGMLKNDAVVKTNSRPIANQAPKKKARILPASPVAPKGFVPFDGSDTESKAFQALRNKLANR